MNDPDKLPLQIPPWQIPYLEKYRILELFHELGRELVIQQPDDHVEFLKRILMNARKATETARVILFGVPKINLTEVAMTIGTHTKQNIITEINVLELLKDVDPGLLTADIKAQCIQYLVRQPKMYETGWILVNCIKNLREAKAILARGILPTHVVHLIASFQPTLTEPLYCNVPVYWPTTRRMIQELREAFKATLKEVYLLDHTLEMVVDECVRVFKMKKAINPIKPRILIIGPRGSGRRTQAQILVDKLKIVHIEFEQYLCELWNSTDDLSQKLRACDPEHCSHSQLLAHILNRRLLEDDCLIYGWVLTGFPFTDIDFKFFDTIETPPNRVIFLECDLAICKERLQHQRYNIHTGSVTNLNTIDTEQEKIKILARHPKDKVQVIDTELSFYCENYGNLRRYCGDTANYINGDQDVRGVHENIMAIIAKDPNPAPPRKALFVDTDSCICSGSCICTPTPSCICLGPCPCPPVPPPLGHTYTTV